MTVNRRRFLQAAGLAAAGGMAGGALAGTTATNRQEGDGFGGLELTVTQQQGNAVNWVLPGRREISEFVFGTPENPQTTGQHWINVAEGPVKKLLEEHPDQVGLPVEQRQTNEAGDSYTVTKSVGPYSDSAEQTSGRLDLTYHDRRHYDRPGDPTDTPDEVDLDVAFTDPDDNQYTIEIGQVFQPPIPPWETGGGVVTNTWLHGVTGTGTPLMPRMYTYGALWAVGNVVVEGEVVNENQVIHFMTTEMIRKTDYALALDEELPLSEDESYLGRRHQTHLMIPPFGVTGEGPATAPVETAFELPNGETQPFVHVMWDEQTIEGAEVLEPRERETATPTGTPENATGMPTDGGGNETATTSPGG